MNWTSGYVSDIEYVNGYYKEQNPGFLNLACILNDVEPPANDTEFTYFELGFGQGLSINLLASAYPKAQFFGNDFNPAHVSAASRMARAAGLDNLTLLENSFAELASGGVQGLPKFDYVVLHGIYTWINEENQGYIISFIREFLKPGGLVYVSYNAMPGWASALPMQRLFTEHSALHPGRSNIQIINAIDFIDQIGRLQAGYLIANATLQPRLESLKTANPKYLVHEYMHTHWQPLYHADVARSFSTAKLDFVGAAECEKSYDNLYLSPERQSLLAEITDGAWRETIKDYFLNTSFRKDVYVRGARKLAQGRKAEHLRSLALVLTVPYDEIQPEMNFNLSIGEVRPNIEVYKRVLEHVSSGPRTIEELLAIPEIAEIGLANLIQVAVVLSSAGKADLYLNTRNRNFESKAQFVNRFIAQETSYHDDFHFLVSPLTGSAYQGSFVERLVVRELFLIGNEAKDIEFFVNALSAQLTSSGRKLMKDGTVIHDIEESLKELRRQITQFFNCKYTIWKTLKIID